MFYKLIPTLFYVISMPQNHDPPREVKPSSPLLSALHVAASNARGTPALRDREWFLSFLRERMQYAPGAVIEAGFALDAIGRASRDDPRVMDAFARATERFSVLGPVAVRILVDNMWAVSTSMRNADLLISVIAVANHVLGEGMKKKNSPEEICQALLRSLQALKVVSREVRDVNVLENVCCTVHSLEGLPLVCGYLSYISKASLNIGGAIPSHLVISRQAKAIAEKAAINQLHAEQMISKLAEELRVRAGETP